MIEFMKGFFQEGKPESSKRLTMILSYVVTLAICAFAVFLHLPVDGNVMTMLLGCCGVSSTAYVTGVKKIEEKKVQDEL
jgi:hypothetical protein